MGPLRRGGTSEPPDGSPREHAEDVADTNANDTGVTAAGIAETLTSEAAADAKPSTAKPGWSGRRLVALIAGVAAASLVLGVVVMQFIVSPATLAARSAAPKAGPVTAPVEERVIENTVVLRGEVAYADAVSVRIDGAGGESKAVITGQVPEVGAVLKQGDIALEIAGRPVIVLPGDLPAYRSLSIGMRGPDVKQLKEALASLGYASGDLSTDTFDWDTATGLGALYEQLGYTPSTGGQSARETLKSAERGVREANLSVAQARAALDLAKSSGAPSTATEQATLDGALQALADAQSTLGEAQAAVLPTLPASEALFLSALPRRVDEVQVKRGDVLSGSPMSVSGATLSVSGTVSKQDAELLSEGLTAQFSAPDGSDLTATIEKIEAPKSGGNNNSNGDGQNPGGGGNGGNGGDTNSSSRYTVKLVPQELTSEQIEALRGTNVRMRIPVAATDGKALAVPLAALSAGSGGENRVELLIDIRDGANAETETVTVEPGLAADGYVEIKSDDKRIKAGAKVVVGK